MEESMVHTESCNRQRYIFRTFASRRGDTADGFNVHFCNLSVLTSISLSTLSHCILSTVHLHPVHYFSAVSLHLISTGHTELHGKKWLSLYLAKSWKIMKQYAERALGEEQAGSRKGRRSIITGQLLTIRQTLRNTTAGEHQWKWSCSIVLFYGSYSILFLYQMLGSFRQNILEVGRER